MRNKNHISCSILFKIKLQSILESPSSELHKQCFFFLEVVDCNIQDTIIYHLCLSFKNDGTCSTQYNMNIAILRKSIPGS